MLFYLELPQNNNIKAKLKLIEVNILSNSRKKAKMQGTVFFSHKKANAGRLFQIET